MGQPVLIIDDDEDIRESLKMALETEGYEIFEAANGREALDLLPKIPNPAVILLDLVMPVMNGWEFLKELSENYGLAGIPVLIITGFSEAFSKKGVPASGVIQKPIDLAELTNTVKQYTTQASSAV